MHVVQGLTEECKGMFSGKVSSLYVLSCSTATIFRLN